MTTLTALRDNHSVTAPASQMLDRSAAPFHDAVIDTLRDFIAAQDAFSSEMAKEHYTALASELASGRFHLALNDGGGVVLTCPEVPSLMVLGDTEEEAVEMARMALQTGVLGLRSSLALFP